MRLSLMYIGLFEYICVWPYNYNNTDLHFHIILFLCAVGRLIVYVFFIINCVNIFFTYSYYINSILFSYIYTKIKNLIVNVKIYVLYFYSYISKPKTHVIIYVATEVVIIWIMWAICDNSLKLYKYLLQLS